MESEKTLNQQRDLFTFYANAYVANLISEEEYRLHKYEYDKFYINYYLSKEEQESL